MNRLVWLILVLGISGCNVSPTEVMEITEATEITPITSALEGPFPILSPQRDVVVDYVDFTVLDSERCHIDATTCEAVKGFLRWQSDAEGAQFTVQESIDEGDWQDLYLVGDTTTMLPDSLAPYSYLDNAQDGYDGDYLIRRGRPATEHRFRVRVNPDGAWVQTDIDTPPIKIERTVDPGQPPPIVPSNRRYDCNAAGALCNNPTAPDAEVNYPSDSRVTVTWTARGGGGDANGSEISARVVDQKWTACPMKYEHWPANGFVYLGDTSRGDCSGKRSGSGTSYSGSFSGEIEAWDVVFKARARNSNRGSIKVCVRKDISSGGSDKGCKRTGTKPANLSGWTTVAGLVYY